MTYRPNYIEPSCVPFDYVVNSFSRENIFPDVDAYDEWKERARHLFLPKRVIVSDLLQRVATNEEREKKIDIGDWLIDALKQKNVSTDMDSITAKPP